MAIVTTIRDRLRRLIAWSQGQRLANPYPQTTIAAAPRYDWAEALHAFYMTTLPTLGDLDILLIGDSLAKQWPVEVWAPQRAYTLGIDGDQTEHVLWRVERIDWTTCRPKHILIVAGTNNLLAGQEAPEIAAGIEAIVSKLQAAYPITVPLVLLPPPLSVGLPRVIATRRALRKRLMARFGRRLVDADAALGPVGPRPNPNFQDDLIHISESGYRVLTDTVRMAIR